MGYGQIIVIAGEIYVTINLLLSMAISLLACQDYYSNDEDLKSA